MTQTATVPVATTNLNQLKPGAFVTLCKITPSGALQARRGADGTVALVWRFTHAARTERVPVGRWSSTRPPKSLEPDSQGGYSIAAAVRAAERLAVEHKNAEGGRPALMAARSAERLARKQATEQARQHTLEALCTAYCDHLEKLERNAHRDARGIFRLHLGALGGIQASQVTDEQVADAMRRLIDAGKERTAGKLRSYLRAAYATAKRARTDPAVPVSFKAFGITLNPAAEAAASAGAARPDKNPATVDELRRYWREVRATSGVQGASLALHLASGGQRVEQLLRLKAADVHVDHIVLYDGKGRPGTQVREHRVPITSAMRVALDGLMIRGEYAISTDADGKVPLSASTLAGWSKTAAKRAEIESDWTIKRVRSGVETLLAASAVSQEHRGRLQSHGISGVQQRHYDGHEYVPEKRAALDTLMRVLEGKSATVTPLKSRKRAGQ